jgi:hypothetical protein
MLLCVDQEGGRVQRFRDGYSKLPPLEGFDALYRRDADAALELAREHAWLMATEIRATGLYLSFAPVVALRRGNRAIGAVLHGLSIICKRHLEQDNPAFGFRRSPRELIEAAHHEHFCGDALGRRADAATEPEHREPFARARRPERRLEDEMAQRRKRARGEAGHRDGLRRHRREAPRSDRIACPDEGAEKGASETERRVRARAAEAPADEKRRRGKPDRMDAEAVAPRPKALRGFAPDEYGG